MELLKEDILQDGTDVKVWHIVTPGMSIPDHVIQYLIGSIGFDSWQVAVQEQNYWRQYYRNAFEGKGAADHLFLAEINGVFAARAWYAYSRRSGYGNFGNVYTEVPFRRR